MDRAQDRLALIELIEREGHPARLVDVHAWPISLGRALDNDIVLDDPHLAAHHARLQRAASGGIELLPLTSRNGVRVAGKPIAVDAPCALPAGGALLQMGTTTVRVRLPGEALAPERVLGPQHAGGMLRPVVVGVLLLALLFGLHAMRLDPGADSSAWLPTLVGLPLAIVGWCGLWALLSKLFQHRFDFSGHLHIALPWMLGLTLVDEIWPQLAAALAWPGMWQLTPMLQGVGGALLVHAHLRHTLPTRPRSVAFAVAALLAVGLGITIAGNLRTNDSAFATSYMSTLPPPALRLRGTMPAAQLVQDMQPLAARLTERARKARDDDRDDSGGAEE